jgi:hypothetical protein
MDRWVARPLIRVHHRRSARVEQAALWTAAESVRLADTRALGRLVRARIPRVPVGASFNDLLRSPPFLVLHEDDRALVSGLVGRIWTLRRDYPVLTDPDEFRDWSTRGTVRVMFAVWVEPAGAGASALVSETRVDAVDLAARLALTAVRPLIATSQNLIGSDGLESAIRRAEGKTRSRA